MEPLFRALLADDPGCWPALLGLGLCARLRRDLPASAEHLAAALALAARDRPVRLEYATTLREQRRIDEAEPIYRALLAEDPAGWPALVGLGPCARMRRDLPASAGDLAAALALAPRDRSVRLEYATTLRELRRSGEAEALYRALLADDPTFWPALLGLGLCARAGQDLVAATAHLAAALALVPRDRAMRLDYAGLLREQRRLDDAEAAYGALHADEPDCWPALVGLGQCARLRRDLDASAGHLATALALAPREPSVRLEYATTLREAGRLNEAEPIYRELLADAPGWWPALVGLGLCARLRRDLVASDEHLAAALALAPDNRTVRLEYATTLREQRRLEEAETVYRKLHADDPGAWQATVGLGLCARMRNDRAAALARFTAAAEAHPEADGPWLEVAAEHREAGRYDAARAVLHTLRDRGTAVAEIWLGLGLVERLAGDRAAAAAAFREGYARHPQRHHLMIEIALDERALGHFAEAERWLRRAAEIEAVAGPALLQLGDLARARHNMDEAIDLLGRAARQPTAPVGVHAMLAQTLADLGRREEAFGVLDAADRQLGPTPETTVKRVFLLRRAGFREEALAVARAAVAAMPDNFPLWIEWFETERFPAISPASTASSPQPRPQLCTTGLGSRTRAAAGGAALAAGPAAAAFGEALALNPLMPLHEALARVHLLRFDIPAAREHLRLMAEQRAPTQREQGLSPHLTHTHIGSLFDEYAMDREALEALVAAQALAPGERSRRLLALAHASPDHTPTAIGLLVALRQAGHFDGPRGDAGAPCIPAKIAQYLERRRGARRRRGAHAHLAGAQPGTRLPQLRRCGGAGLAAAALPACGAARLPARPLARDQGGRVPARLAVRRGRLLRRRRRPLPAPDRPTAAGTGGLRHVPGGVRHARQQLPRRLTAASGDRASASVGGDGDQPRRRRHDLADDRPRPDHAGVRKHARRVDAGAGGVAAAHPHPRQARAGTRGRDALRGGLQDHVTALAALHVRAAEAAGGDGVKRQVPLRHRRTMTKRSNTVALNGRQGRHIAGSRPTTGHADAYHAS